MKLSIITTTILLFVAFASIGQKKYISPPPILGDGYKIVISSIESAKGTTSFSMEVYNESRNQYLTIDPEKNGIEYPGLGLYFATFAVVGIKKNIVMEPGKKKTLKVKVEGDFDHKVASMQIHINGVRMGLIPNESTTLEKMEFVSGKKETIKTGALTVDVTKVKENKDNLSVSTEFKFSTSNTENELFLFDPSTVTASAEGVDVVLEVSPNKLSDIDFDSDLKVNLKAEGSISSILVDWGTSLKRIALTDVKIPVFTISDKSAVLAGSVAETPVKSDPVASTPVPVKSDPEPVIVKSTPAPVTTSAVSANPKVKEKKGMITLDDVDYLTVMKEGKMFVYSNLMGDLVLETKFVTYRDKAEVSDANPEGKVHYVEIYFPGSSVYGEKTAGLSMKKKMPGIMYKRKIIPLNGVIDMDKANAYIATLGTPHTQRRKELYPEVIIERETILVKQRETIIIEKNSGDQGKKEKRAININIESIIKN